MEHEDYMQMAMLARKDANCSGRNVGAAMVLASGAVLLGYNGTPEVCPTCIDGGCGRCADPKKYGGSGHGYDKCACVHAEERCILAAGRAAASGATVYSTLRPCFQCSKQMLEVDVYAVYYLDDFEVADVAQRAAYVALQARFRGGVYQVTLEANEDAA